MTQHQHDVIVIGAGPAGSTASNLLAQQGHDVVVIDKETFPRFHIGESLLPCGMEIYERLGLDLDRCQFLRKAGAEFIDERTGQHATYDFSDALPGGSPYAYQVERATFDHELLRAAVRAGAVARMGEKVTDIQIDESGVEVTLGGARLRARYCVDSTGQDAFFGRRGRSLEPHHGFGKAAVFCHFNGVARDVHESLFPRGHIKVVMLRDGWAWLIPLRGDKVSCGVVSSGTGITTALLDEFITSSSVVQTIARGASRSEGQIIRNFSFKNRKSHGSRWVCIGDAACFLDPVFSSGVSLAVLSGERMSRLLSPALRDRREGEASLMAPLHADMEIAYNSVGALIHSFYHTNIIHNLFFAEDPSPEIRKGIISVLAGDVWRSDNQFQRMLLRSVRRKPRDGAPLELTAMDSTES